MGPGRLGRAGAPMRDAPRLPPGGWVALLATESKERAVTAVAPQDVTLKEIEEEIRRAWSVYSQELQGLSGEDYEVAEDERWAALQEELERLERRRSALAGAAA